MLTYGSRKLMVVLPPWRLMRTQSVRSVCENAPRGPSPPPPADMLQSHTTISAGPPMTKHNHSMSMRTKS